MDKLDVWKFRAEEFERSFYSLRTLEWQVHTMYYAGLVMVISGLWTISSREGIDRVGAAWAAGLCVVALFFATTWLQVRVQERMFFAREMQKELVRLIQEAVSGSAPMEPPSLKDKSPKYRNVWAKAPMRFLNALACVAAAAGAFGIAR